MTTRRDTSALRTERHVEYYEFKGKSYRMTERWNAKHLKWTRRCAPTEPSTAKECLNALKSYNRKKGPPS